MEVFQTRTLHLKLCVIVTLLTNADYAQSFKEQRIQQHINKTVFVGEIVTLHCNKTVADKTITWKMNNSVIFSHDSYSNRTKTNLNSNRIHINPAVPRELKIHQIQAADSGNYSCFPAAIRWTLTITENKPASVKQMQLYIIISCSGVIMVCLIITISICIHRRWKNNKDSSHRETGQDFAPARGSIQTQNSQYFERYNSVYGQI